MSVLLYTEDIQKLCRIGCQFLGTGSYCKEKKSRKHWRYLSYQNEKRQSLLTSRQNLQQMLLCYDYCYEKEEHNNNSCLQNLDWAQCSALPHLWQNSTSTKGFLEPENLGPRKKSKGRPKAETKDSFCSQSLFDSFALQIESIIPATVTLQEVNNEDLNPHFSLWIYEICSEIIKKPIIKTLKCETNFV